MLPDTNYIRFSNPCWKIFTFRTYSEARNSFVVVPNATICKGVKSDIAFDWDTIINKRLIRLFFNIIRVGPEVLYVALIQGPKILILRF